MMDKKRKRYGMDMEGKSITTSAALMGLAFFLRAVYYFGCVRVENVGFWELLCWLILPMLLEAAVIVLVRVVRLNAPGIYAILAAAFSLVLIFQTFGYGNLFRTILEIVLYLGCGVLLLGVAGGFLSKQIAVAAYALTALVRFFCFEMVQYVFRLRVVDFLIEATGLCVLAGLAFLASSFKLTQKPKHKNPVE